MTNNAQLQALEEKNGRMPRYEQDILWCCEKAATLYGQDWSRVYGGPRERWREAVKDAEPNSTDRMQRCAWDAVVAWREKVAGEGR